MSATAHHVSTQHSHASDGEPSVNAVFLRYLPAVKTHAEIQFRHLSPVDREEVVAEALAAAFLNVHSAVSRGTTHRLSPSTVARYAVLRILDGRKSCGLGGNKTDAMSAVAQRLHGFKMVGLPWNGVGGYDCMRDPTSTVWKAVLLEDRSTPVPDQAAFRVDWSRFLGGQTDRTRQALSMLAEGHRQIDVADKLGVTPAAVCQRVKKAEREWETWQGVNAGDGPVQGQVVCS